MTIASPDKSQETTIVVFQERGSGNRKIGGIERYGKNIRISRVIDIDAPLPGFIDAPEEYIPDDFEGDLALSFLRHPDLLAWLAELCRRKGMPLIASGKKAAGAITPFTCCGLVQRAGLGRYGEQFGLPELEVRLDQEQRIVSARVVRGASCGATWEALQKLVGQPLAEALVNYAREVQYLCQADPSGFDPVTGKSPVHYAGHVHASALRKAAGLEGVDKE
ncbi:MAG: DUF166 family (seleno)protein DfsP [Thermodesulfobacteriota bacterium]